MGIPDWRESSCLSLQPRTIPPSLPQPSPPQTPIYATHEHPPGFPLASKTAPHRHMIRPATPLPQSVISSQWTLSWTQYSKLNSNALSSWCTIEWFHHLEVHWIQFASRWWRLRVLWKRLFWMGHGPHMPLHPLHHLFTSAVYHVLHWLCLSRLLQGKSKEGRAAAPDSLNRGKAWNKKISSF